MTLNVLKNRQLMTKEINDLIVSHEKVAHVQLENRLDHALLVLIKSGYTAVPVLDRDYRVKGQISKTEILDSILGLEQLEMERLHDITVETAMNKNIPRLRTDATFQKALTTSINHPFICIVDDDDAFVGILTRRSILALVHRYLQ
ncbi:MULTISPECIES: cyclic-di-AMP-binding protein CbpB [Geomicrobium]|uniref:CBS domain-containing protein n=1 Tax=Geomicrobium sediminis TaxID=1347788 RepID=A0ABS2PIA8_9BACL|nr:MULTISPECIES: cyclic-di-AMP-binding protein CbpB [Geomicrobium]MBM7635084.1 CBS domain-containing protein [Geomicrobium sediminis]GAJ99673.1 CBS domain protein [Geomicrobium sp. JCM 19055]